MINWSSLDFFFRQRQYRLRFCKKSVCRRISQRIYLVGYLPVGWTWHRWIFILVLERKFWPCRDGFFWIYFGYFFFLNITTTLNNFSKKKKTLAFALSTVSFRFMSWSLELFCSDQVPVECLTVEVKYFRWHVKNYILIYFR